MDADLDNAFKALADASRRRLLDVLHADNGQTLGRLCEHLDMTRQAVSKHLAVLEEANLVVTLGGAARSCTTSIRCRSMKSRSGGSASSSAGRLRVLAELKKRLEGETDG